MPAEVAGGAQWWERQVTEVLTGVPANELTSLEWRDPIALMTERLGAQGVTAQGENAAARAADIA